LPPGARPTSVADRPKKPSRIGSFLKTKSPARWPGAIRCDSIGLIGQAEKCKDNDVLEFAKVIATTHYLYNIE
jgi:hypothetical protein